MMTRTAASSRASARRTNSASPGSTGAICGMWAWRMMSTNNRVLGLDAAEGKRFPEYFGCVGWAKRSVPTNFDLRKDGGHVATRLCPPYTSSRHRYLIQEPGDAADAAVAEHGEIRSLDRAVAAIV